MRIVIGCDHGGFALKEAVKAELEKKHSVEDLGARKVDPADDYTDYAYKVAVTIGAAEQKKLFQDEVRGILLCRSAAGMVIAANKVKGARAVAAYDEKTAEHSRLHNASNIIALSGNWTDASTAKKIIGKWLQTPFSNEERHIRRLKKIMEIEKKCCSHT